MTLLVLLCLLFAAPTTYDLPKKGPAVRVVVEPLGPVGGPGYTMDVAPDGTVSENGEALPARMTARELQALLRFIIETKKLGAFDAAAVAREKKGVGVCGTGATTTGIHLLVPGHKKTVKVDFLDLFANLPSLRSAAAVKARLQLEARLARHGGRQNITALIAIVNKHPKMKGQPPLTLAAFQEVRADGAHFRRETQAPLSILTAVVKDGKAKVTFLQ